jgi:hypothetical protein
VACEPVSWEEEGRNVPVTLQCRVQSTVWTWVRVLTLHPWAHHSFSLSLSALSCKVGLIIIPVLEAESP